MQSKLLLMLIWTQLSWAIDSQPTEQNQNIELPAVIRVYFDQQQQLQQLAALTDLWAVNKQQKFATIYVEEQYTYQKLSNLNLALRIDHKLMAQLAKVQVNREQNTPGTQGTTGIPGFACYSTVEETFQRMEQMASTHPNLAEIIDIGDSWEKTINAAEGHDIKILKITNQNIAGDKPILFLASAIHAREYATAELNTRFAEYLLTEYDQNADVTWIVDNHEIHLSLQTNPDGRKQAETGLLWRKNTNQAYCSPNSDSRGADLNRNYSFEWAASNDQCSATFSGGAPESEPELDAQMTYIREIFTDNRGPGINDAVADDTTGLFVDIHSYSELVLYPWGYSDADSPNENQFRALGKRTAYFNNYLPQAASDLYPTFGASIDTTYGELGVASLVFELGTAFFQDCETFESSVLPDNLAALMYLARVSQAPYKQPLGPDIEHLVITPNVITAGTQIQINGTANDDRYSQNNGTQSTETVQSVSAYINQLPINASSGTALAAADGSFDQVAENFIGSLPTTGLNTGKNTLYVQAHDGARAGASYAEFVDVVDAKAVATLAGRVTNAVTGASIADSLLIINQSNRLSLADGSYSMLVQPAVADLVVSASNYLPQSLSGLNLQAGQTTNQDIQLQPICEIFHDDVENGNKGWTTQSTWAISTEFSNTPSSAWSDSPGGNYAPNSNTALTSPNIMVTDTEFIEISYSSYCDTEADYDYGYFEVQYDDSAWQTIGACDGQNAWRSESHQLNLPANTDVLRFRFRLQTDSFVETDGWYIDDVSVTSSGMVCGTANDDIIFIDGFE